MVFLHFGVRGAPKSNDLKNIKNQKISRNFISHLNTCYLRSLSPIIIIIYAFFLLCITSDVLLTVFHQWTQKKLKIHSLFWMGFHMRAICIWYCLGNSQIPLLIGRLTLYKKWKFSIKDFFSECDQIQRKLQIWSYLLKKLLMKNFIFNEDTYAEVISAIMPLYQC